MINSQRAERVVIRYFNVRIRVRGGATRLGSGFVPHPEQTQIHPYHFLLAEGGVGEAALNIERMGLGFIRPSVLYTSFVSYSVLVSSLWRPEALRVYRVCGNG